MSNQELRKQRALQKASNLTKRAKTEVDLVQVAIDRGFEINEKGKWGSGEKKTAELKRGGDRILVRKADSGDYIYSNVSNISGGGGGQSAQASGSIIDFFMNEEGMNFKNARQEALGYIGVTLEHPTVNLQKASDVVYRTVEEVQTEIASFTQKHDSDLSYLAKRGIDSDKLNADSRFDIRQDSANYNNLVFPVRNLNGQICGYEKKNDNFKGYATRAEKGVYFAGSLRNANEPKTVIVTESVIDAISVAEMKKDLGRGNPSPYIYMSIGGAIGVEQEAILRKVFENENVGKVVSAVDNDKAGNDLHLKLQGLVPNGLEFEREIPVTKDWNQDLQEVFPKEVSKKFDELREVVNTTEKDGGDMGFGDLKALSERLVQQHGNKEITEVSQNINLAEFAQQYGFKVNNEQSSEVNAILNRESSGEEISVFKQDGEYRFQNNDIQSGNIVDFIGEYQNMDANHSLSTAQSYLNADLVKEGHNIEKVEITEGKLLSSEERNLYAEIDSISASQQKSSEEGKDGIDGVDGVGDAGDRGEMGQNQNMVFTPEMAENLKEARKIDGLFTIKQKLEEIKSQQESENEKSSNEPEKSKSGLDMSDIASSLKSGKDEVKERISSINSKTPEPEMSYEMER